ncbi:Transposable element Tcb1 transposase, partial [Stegodyphus mimosarum]
MFSDESRFSSQSDSRRTFIWRASDTRYHQENIIERHRYGGAGLLVWGGIIQDSRTDLHVQIGTMTSQIYRHVILEQHVRLFRGAMGAQFVFMDDNARPYRANIAVFTWHGLGPLVQMNRSLTGNGYLQLLGDHLQPFMDFTYSNNDGIFMDDNAPCHRTTIVRDWLEEHSGQFQRMIWSPRSPDMNSIEHLWDIIERLVRAQNPSPSTLPQLWTSIEGAWLNIPAGDFQRLVESMPRRVAALRRAKRGPTKY